MNNQMTHPFPPMFYLSTRIKFYPKLELQKKVLKNPFVDNNVSIVNILKLIDFCLLCIFFSLSLIE